MFNQVGPLEILLVLGIALIVFGPKRLPELGRSAGKGIREFRSSLSGDRDEAEEPKRELSQGEGVNPPAGEAAAEPVEGEVLSERKA
ncbi:MAG: sec-independent protein translocase protein TatA [Solirubrobacterales bacterium]|jgi:TatA/E family protein of Tat protein translocase|nr:sec-independent protein translocase protein TatA [Solirubrobacterales bacterium]MDX6663295.1 sec-independent protein translocase protein TatA [Solirubrobacterales bacterium]